MNDSTSMIVSDGIHFRSKKFRENFMRQIGYMEIGSVQLCECVDKLWTLTRHAGYVHYRN